MKERMPMKKIIPLFIISLAWAACSDKKADVETPAGIMLDNARTLMMQKHYDAARDSIEQMRQLYPTAFAARSAGIIVMDSIELLSAQDSLAVLDSILQKERAVFEEIKKQNNRGANSPFYTQKNKVFYLEQNFDEICAKIKFYLRKIEVDKEKDKSND